VNTDKNLLSPCGRGWVRGTTEIAEETNEISQVYRFQTLIYNLNIIEVLCKSLNLLLKNSIDKPVGASPWLGVG
jgi:hypothetical protein